MTKLRIPLSCLRAKYEASMAGWALETANRGETSSFDSGWRQHLATSAHLHICSHESVASRASGFRLCFAANAEVEAARRALEIALIAIWSSFKHIFHRWLTGLAPCTGAFGGHSLKMFVGLIPCS